MRSARPLAVTAGRLAGVRTDDLAAVPIAELRERNPQLDVSRIDDVIFGCANQAGEDNRNVGRMALLLAGLPRKCPGRRSIACAAPASMRSCRRRARSPAGRCRSSSPAASRACRGRRSSSERPTPRLRAGSSSRTPRSGGDSSTRRCSRHWHRRDAETAENVAAEWRIRAPIRTRSRFAASSAPPRRPQADASRKRSSRSLSNSEGIDRRRRRRAPARRHHARGPGQAQAGRKAGRHGDRRQRVGHQRRRMRVAARVRSGSERARPDARARYVAGAVAGVAPRVMGIGPVPATSKLLARTGLTIVRWT